MKSGSRLGPPLYYLLPLFDLIELQKTQVLQAFLGILILLPISRFEPAITDFWDKSGIKPGIHIRTLSLKLDQQTEDKGEF